jgi:ABC-type Na+ transport system ATPase subunit NatA
LQQIFHHVNRGKKHIKSYGAQKALDNISFSINKGEIVGFGSKWRWKIDLMKILTTYINADEGMLWNGIM